MVYPSEPGATPETLCPWMRATPTRTQQGATRSPVGLAQPDRTPQMAAGLVSVVPSAQTFPSDEMKDATELTVGISSAGFEFDRGCRR